ncbi:ergothioneine biosynthesis protein EgtB [Lacisediminimonas profundi]|uniref:ergothioneine biosynthesis protein EgtB n=1 Tax=Lacisediminimonas profundi TaxID=2603856 RepID=UPI00124B4968|nr:ergothioneine biosynthesis protein EgtB [Lacisediminimonas profundi]
MAESDHPIHTPDQLLARYQAVRGHSVALAAGLSEEDCCAQSMPDASPVKWHLAHVTWFFEIFILEELEQDFRPFHPAFRMLFNSYYNGVGDRHARAQRGLLTRPALREVLAYRDNVDRRMAGLIGGVQAGRAARLAALVELGLHHEQQHQELLLTDVKHLFSMSPLYPALYSAAPSAGPPAFDPASDERKPLPPASSQPGWLCFEGGVSQMGHDGRGFGFDNEGPRHRVFVEPFMLARGLVSNARYLEFIAAGGYDDPRHWLSEGWEWRCSLGVHAPFYWRRDEAGGWNEFTLRGLQLLEPDAPVNHLSYYEADACARWCGARLPTEAEWEHAAALHEPSFQDLYGSRWQWTSSSYAPYPGYRPAGGAIGEYNGKFMVNQYVLRGSSCATPPGHARRSYRNFFPAGARWQFTGLRLAQSTRQSTPQVR